MDTQDLCQAPEIQWWVRTGPCPREVNIDREVMFSLHCFFACAVPLPGIPHPPTPPHTHFFLWLIPTWFISLQLSAQVLQFPKKALPPPHPPNVWGSFCSPVQTSVMFLAGGNLSGSSRGLTEQSEVRRMDHSSGAFVPSPVSAT